MKKHKDHTVAVALIKRLAADPAVDPALRRKLTSASEELRKVRGMNQPNRNRVMRLVRLLSETLWDAFKEDGDSAS